jgi:hypothetical protein
MLLSLGWKDSEEFTWASERNPEESSGLNKEIRKNTWGLERVVMNIEASERNSKEYLCLGEKFEGYLGLEEKFEEYLSLGRKI